MDERWHGGSGEARGGWSLGVFEKVCVCGLSVVSHVAGKKHDWMGLWSGARSESEEWGAELARGQVPELGKGQVPTPHHHGSTVGSHVPWDVAVSLPREAAATCFPSSLLSFLE